MVCARAIYSLYSPSCLGCSIASVLHDASAVCAVLLQARACWGASLPHAGVISKSHRRLPRSLWQYQFAGEPFICHLLSKSMPPSFCSVA